uniref:Uncharacterized protein n=1 Tax=Romanomermis culicivorax TaxID=13658 RepID=A0A915IHK5_ROMCU
MEEKLVYHEKIIRRRNVDMENIVNGRNLLQTHSIKKDKKCTNLNPPIEFCLPTPGHFFVSLLYQRLQGHAGVLRQHFGSGVGIILQ